MRFWKRLRISGGPRADLLLVSIDDHLAGLIDTGTSPRQREGVAPGLHASAEYEIARWITPVLSFGQGFCSLDEERLPAVSFHPYTIDASVGGVLRFIQT